MPDITLEGIVNRSGRGKKAVIFIDHKDEIRLKRWWIENHIDTKLDDINHPISHRPCPQIGAETTARDIKDRQPVKITIDIRPYVRGGRQRIGIKTVSIEPIEG